MDEPVFLNDRQVQVTQTRFIVPGQTYAMSGVTSVADRVDRPSKKWPIVIIIIGALVMLGGFSEDVTSGFVGMGILSASIAWFWFLKSTYYVVLHSASGESRALESHDKEWIDQVISALNEAIVARG